MKTIDGQGRDIGLSVRAHQSGPVVNHLEVVLSPELLDPVSELVYATVAGLRSVRSFRQRTIGLRTAPREEVARIGMMPACSAIATFGRPTM
jgi:hypothetical protein